MSERRDPRSDGETTLYLEELEKCKGIGTVVRVDGANDGVHLRVVARVGKTEEEAAHQSNGKTGKEKVELRKCSKLLSNSSSYLEAMYAASFDC